MTKRNLIELFNMFNGEEILEECTLKHKNGNKLESNCRELLVTSIVSTI